MIFTSTPLQGVAAALVLLLSSSVAWASEPTASAMMAPPVAVTSKPFLANRVAIENFIPAAPAEGSNADRADKAETARVIKKRTEASCARAKADAELSPFTAYAGVLGVGFTPEAYPKLAALFGRAGMDTWVAVRDAKALWNRPRPAAANPAIVTCAPLPKDGSYPSGHALYSRVTGSILSNLVPAKVRALRARSDQYGYERVIAGVHYASDIKAGQQGGDAVVKALMADTGFRAALEAARLETEPLRSK